MFEIQETQHGVRIAIKVIPNASSDQLAGVLGDRLKIRVSAPPEGGKANKAVCVFIAKVLEVRVKDVTVISGLTNPMKTIEVLGITRENIRRKLDL